MTKDAYLNSTGKSLSAEELANALTHGLGLVLSIGGFIALIILAIMHGDFWHILSSAIYGSSLVILYGASTLYHSSRSERARRNLRLADHIAIYLLIAGSYTPFALVLLREDGGWAMFLLVWSIAAAGILFKLTVAFKYPIISTLFYVAMGWLAMLFIVPLLRNLPSGGFYLIAAGGFFYTVGVPFYAATKMKFAHSIWHVFVLLGSLCHFLAVLWYVLPG